LLCEGAALLDVMGVEGVVGTETSCNHIFEVRKALGIEACRASIGTEVKRTMDAYGVRVDARHLMLLADLMTAKGEVLGITRFGIAKMKDSVLMLASFEKTTDHLFNAALRGNVDQLDGVSESIIMGVPIPLGTGMFNVVTHHEPAPRLPPARLSYALQNKNLDIVL
jgi:DNA-directed RNA polymerase III subunit RPC1